MIDLNGPYVPPASGGEAKQLVVFLHGLGSNGDDLIALAPHFAQFLPDAAFVSPNAPEPCEGVPMGFQWFALWDRTEGQVLAGLHAATPVLNGFIDAQLEEHGLQEKDLALVGFSQGTMMALNTAPQRDHPCAAVIGYSGMFLDKTIHMKSTPPVLLVHGSADEVVPVTAMGEAEATLKEHGVVVNTLLRPGLGHGIDPEGIIAGAQFLKSKFQVI